MKLRVGFGYDVHQLLAGRELWLGGVKIESPFGALGHSDADVLLHAICDAILGAAGLRDIGFHFPDTDPVYKGADSKLLLKRVMELITEKGWKVENMDSTLCLENPKINPYVPAMKQTISSILNIDQDAVSIKATTNEQMGFVGRQEGLTAYATVLLIGV
ncbi:MAG: 2-C-methyl-D-erythritol 2,4-cyclodiphosphate synthase [Flavobacteriaceae bacterium]|nr:2-C-methyl-D-erythritol 2,4-cyclodiphosphate synthase [Flavobacteriaceae bacterium]